MVHQWLAANQTSLSILSDLPSFLLGISREDLAHTRLQLPSGCMCDSGLPLLTFLLP